MVWAVEGPLISQVFDLDGKLVKYVIHVFGVVTWKMTSDDLGVCPGVQTCRICKTYVWDCSVESDVRA